MKSSSTVQNGVVGVGARPAPETPLAASTMSAGRLDQPGVEQRGERQRRRRHVAAGRGDQPGALRARRGGARAGRTRPRRAARAGRARSRTTAGTARRPSAGTRPTGRRRSRRAPTSCGASAIDASCGQAEEDDVERRRRRRASNVVSSEVRVGRGERRVQVAGRRAGLGVGGGDDDLEVGVGGEQAQQLGAGEPGRADDRRRERLIA